MPAVIYSLGPDGAKKSDQKLREALLAGAVVGYLCKHNATLVGGRRRLPGRDRRRLGDGRARRSRRRMTSRRRSPPTPPAPRSSTISA